MQRRQWLLGAPTVVMGLNWSANASAQVVCVPPPSTGGIDAVAEIKALRIPSGPYKGGYELAPNGKLNWYFANLGLLPLVRVLGAAELDTYVRTYLDLYLASLEPNGSIQDIELPYGRANPTVFKKVLSDSDDAYAATFLSLAARYVSTTGNWSWWEANKAKLKTVAYRNLALAIKPSGLTTVFQSPRSQTNSLGYLMDNCEGYRGLRDIAAILRGRSEVLDANYYDLLATNTVQGIRSQLYHPNARCFLASDASTAPGKVFYPDTSCQVYPQVFGVTELEPLFANGWAYLNAQSPGWETGKYDPFPWAVLGYAAALRGQSAQAKSQLASIEKIFVTNRSLVTINELGFYLRTRAVLDGALNT